MTVAQDDILRILFPNGTEEQLSKIREVIRQHHASNDFAGRMARIQELADKIRAIVRS